jgi:Amt family ammonium transporter
MDTILLFMLPAGLWAQDAGVAATTAAPDATAGALGELATGLNTVWPPCWYSSCNRDSHW